MLLLYIGALILFYILARKRLEVLFPLVVLRSKRFTETINTFGWEYRWYLRKLFTLGVWIGGFLMIYSFYYLIQGVMMLKQESMPRLTPLIPGTSVGGITFPLVQGILTLGIVVLVHEFGHGIAAAAEGIGAKNVAFVLLLGFIPGGGVEMNSKKLEKARSLSRLRVMCAGSFVNVLLAGVVLLLSIPLMILGQGYTVSDGMRVISVDPNSPASGVLSSGIVITSINGIETRSVENLNSLKDYIKPDSLVTLKTDKGVYALITSDEGRIGFSAVPATRVIDDPIAHALSWVSSLLSWVFIATIGLSIANMMPLWPFDGGYMIKELLDNIRVGRIKLTPITGAVYAMTLLLVLINLFSNQLRTVI